MALLLMKLVLSARVGDLVAGQPLLHLGHALLHVLLRLQIDFHFLLNQREYQCIRTILGRLLLVATVRVLRRVPE